MLEKVKSWWAEDDTPIDPNADIDPEVAREFDEALVEFGVYGLELLDPYRNAPEPAGAPIAEGKLPEA